MATVRPRVLAVVVVALILGACTGQQTFVPTTTTVPSATKPLLAVDLLAAPTGLVPVAYGDAQLSVPASFSVVYPGENALCGSAGPRGALFVAPLPSTQTGTGCPAKARGTLVSLVPARHVPAKYANETPIILNGVPVYLGPTDNLLSSYTYYAPALGVEVAADGPLARQVIDTLACSPRAEALALGTAPSVPASWHSVSFAGLRLSFPADWPVERTETWNLCGPVQVAIAQGVALDTDKAFLALPCPAPLPFPVMPSDGVRVDGGAQGPTGSFSAGGACLHVGGLTVCPSSTPDYSVLLLRVAVPGRATPVFVSVGLAGNGMVARSILYSLRAA
jgi:hypothetical protein